MKIRPPLPAGSTLILSRNPKRIKIAAPHGPVMPLRQKIVKHSPTGMEWGYGGSGPADLALNLTALFTDEPERHYQAVKWEFIASADRDGALINLDDVRAFIEQRIGGGS